ncbi:MAG: aminotransferase class V-fold PLP-dependent enzyme [candidate division Zixibacteria bacterium]|nr:aminotransferase class V-fold PLP-dependent enzyme [candidate division Zixibacteria bacterium]
MLTPICAPNTRHIAPDDTSYWSQVRAHFMLEPGQVYLNNAALGLPPKPVTEAVGRGFARLAENPTGAKRAFYRYIEESVRPGLAAFLGVQPEEIALTRNATESLYDVVNGLRLASGDRVLTTTQEHPSAVRPWTVRAARTGIRVEPVFIPSPVVSETDIETRIRGAIDDRTRVLFFCHITRGGYLYPVANLSALGREYGLVTAVDGAQAVGAMSVNLADLGCDLYANSLHKWFLGPSGTGFLYVRKNVRAAFSSLFYEEDEGEPGAARYETLGTYDLPVRAALGTALDFLNRIGIANIEMRLRMLSGYLRERLRGISRVRLLSPISHTLSSPGATLFEIDGIPGSSLVGPFFDAGLHVDDHTRDGHDGMRISTHYYNTLEEIDRCVDMLETLIRSR